MTRSVSIRITAIAFAFALAIHALPAQCPDQGSDLAGVEAWTAANCPANGCLNLAATCNGNFTILFLGSATSGNLVTFGYTVCQISGQQALSHWIIGLDIPCLGSGNTLSDLVVGATLNGQAIVPVVGLDPTTQVTGIKFNEGVAGGSCNDFTVTFDISVLDSGYTLGTGCTTAATKAGNQDIQRADRLTPGYACIIGPVCEILTTTTCWQGETAWSAGTRYTAKGNWATFTAYAGVETSAILWAGQTHNAGTVGFSDMDINGNVSICILLNPGFRLADTLDNVKIQGYGAAPSGNPAPGQFANKYTANVNPFCVVLPASNFFGIHLDVEREIVCP